jgi:hypothetical protein
LIKTMSTEEVLGLALCTGLGDVVKASAGASWRPERRPAGLIRTPKRQADAQRPGLTATRIVPAQGLFYRYTPH